jgi:hypothetical protein
MNNLISNFTPSKPPPDRGRLVGVLIYTALAKSKSDE